MTVNEIFNNARLCYRGLPLSRYELEEALRELPKYTSFSALLTELVKQKAIIRKKKGIYTFTTYPIHKNILDSVYNNLKNKQKEYNKSYRNKKKDKSDDIEKAINLLLSTGEYDIYHVVKTKL